MTDAETALRSSIRAALEERDQRALTRVLVGAIGIGTDLKIKGIAEDELRKTDHDTQTWWAGDCNCDGHLN